MRAEGRYAAAYESQRGAEHRALGGNAATMKEVGQR